MLDNDEQTILQLFQQGLLPSSSHSDQDVLVAEIAAHNYFKDFFGFLQAWLSFSLSEDAV